MISSKEGAAAHKLMTSLKLLLAEKPLHVAGSSAALTITMVNLEVFFLILSSLFLTGLTVTVKCKMFRKHVHV